ncbi:2Fe-2S ferredoxin [Tamilnaduibacter salinus]|uniref:2Fe-2S ferredoxin n=1 Tax=Tamilnaduibacter salinus TaxID=1484056 RepID=A0A2U1CTR4_9GAMM|nr:2Fe-2S iron-sulfur cluster-binding protein [Tamilnaduibacter salinus]PVY70087.1 2Fe-2S ferredoxin [Tamilnaduibacter salinus]
MGTVRLVEHDGTEHLVDIEDGHSLMEIATTRGVPGVDADCGRCCACGTCHVLVDPAWTGTLRMMEDDEQQVLALNPETASNSRLACQLTLSGTEHDGLVMHLPECQM